MSPGLVKNDRRTRNVRDASRQPSFVVAGSVTQPSPPEKRSPATRPASQVTPTASRRKRTPVVRGRMW
jgi:hypothetical protein